jgi:hypothetical protein
MTKFQPGPGYGFKQSGYGLTIDTTDPFPTPTYIGDAHPFKVVNLGPISEVFSFRVIAGSVNGLIPQLGALADANRRLDHLPSPAEPWTFSATTNYSYIYLDVGCDTSVSPSIFPVTNQANTLYPRVISSDVEKTSTDSNGYILIATAYKNPTTNAITIWQLVRSSLWSDRIKVAGSTAKYFFAAV